MTQSNAATSTSAAQRLLIALFVVMLITPALVQVAVDLHRGQVPRLAAFVTTAPTAQNLHRLEREIQDDSVAVRTLRPWMQGLQYATTREVGPQALVTWDGWWSFRPGFDFLAKRRTSADTTPEQAAAAVIDVRDQLARRGIRLIVMPVPNKESIHGERLNAGLVHSRAPLSRETAVFLQQCQQSGVEVVDLFARFATERIRDDRALYLAQDSHWNSAGIAVAVAAVAERLASVPSTATPIDYRTMSLTVPLHGDLVRMQRSPPVEWLIAPEISVVEQVIVGTTDMVYADDPQADVLVMGDSFLRIFQHADPGGAGYIAHLARALKRPVTSLVNDGGGATLVRQELFRRPRLLTGKHIVIWEFVERDLRYATEGWQIVPLPAAP